MKAPRTILNSEFFSRKTHLVAKDLLGKFLVRKTGKGEIISMITEVEIYDGFLDKASHAHKGITPRTKIMYGEPGNWYVYFTYGMHWMLNVVTRERGYPAAILIRGTENVKGPGRLTKYFHINGALNGLPADKKSGLWIEDRGIRIKSKDIEKTPRIGIAYAQDWIEKPLRFSLLKSAETSILGNNMKSSKTKKPRHRDAPGRVERAKQGKVWEEYKAKVMGKGPFSPDKLERAITNFKQGGPKIENTRAFKPSGKKPISRPK